MRFKFKFGWLFEDEHQNSNSRPFLSHVVLIRYVMHSWDKVILDIFMLTGLSNGREMSILWDYFCDKLAILTYLFHIQDVLYLT